MLRSLYSGVSGLSVNQSSMDVIGNNIANVNTIGFKQSRAVFQDLLSQTLVGGKTPTDSRGGINPRQVGSGAYLAAVDNIFSDGVVKGTQKTTDLAVQGNGMFVVRGEGNNEYYYTRAGDFNFDRSQTLTTPSGYKVQGWMSDPDTGALKLDGGVSDIVLGTAYQVMKPKASTEVNFAGTLDTTAKASILKYPQFLTQATAGLKFSSLKSESGTALDLGTNEKVTIKAHATGKTFMSEVFNSGGTPMNLTDGSQVQFTIGTTPYSISYKAVDKGNPSDGEFNSVDSFIQEVNNIFKKAATGGAGPVATMSMEDGKFKITGNSAITISDISGSSNLTSLLLPLKGTYGAGYAKHSSEAFFQKDITSTEDFNNLTELGLQVENALNGSVVTNGFKVEFLENNFGLKEGETVTFDHIDVAGTNAGPLSFTYTDKAIPAAGEFHTIQELAKLLTDGVNLAGVASGTSITFGVSNNQIKMTHQTGGAVTFGDGVNPTVTLGAAVGGAQPNPYLSNLLNDTLNNGGVINVANKTIQTGELAGKGRLAYNYASTIENTVDVTNNKFGMSNGNTLSFVFNDGAVDHNISVKYTTGTPGAGEFNTMASLVTAINAQLTAAGLTTTTVTLSGADTLQFSSGAAGVNIKSVITDSGYTALAGQLDKLLSGKTLTAVATETSATIANERIEAITGLSIMKASKGDIFNNNMLAANSIGMDTSITSKRFLAVADTTSKIVDLFGNGGVSFGFNENESINLSASIGGEKVTNPDSFNVGTGTTVLDLMTAMENYLGLGADHNSLKNVILTDGMIQVTGEKGQGNVIDYFNLTSPLSKNAAFNNTMSNVTVAQAASGGYAPTSIDIFDEQGNKHVVNFKFSLWNEERNEWRMTLTPNDEANSVFINGATTNELIMKFNSDGTLAYLYDRFPDPQKILVNPTIRFSAANGTNTLENIKLNLGTQGTNDGMSLAAGVGGFRQNSSDGYAMGELKEKLFNPAGELVGTYSNGQIRTLAQVSLATFTNQQGLLKVGDTMFAATGSSGQPTLGAAQSGGRGDVAASSLENSNVDISQELVSMITTQRGFQANSKVITTSDEMIQEVLNMKR